MPNVAIGPKLERTEFVKLWLYEIFETPAPSVTVAVLGVVAFANSSTFPQPFGQSSAVILVRSPFAPALGGMSACGSYGVRGPSAQSTCACARNGSNIAAIESSERLNSFFMANLRDTRHFTAREPIRPSVSSHARAPSFENFTDVIALARPPCGRRSPGVWKAGAGPESALIA